MKHVLFTLTIIVLGAGVVSAQNVDNFVINDYQVEMELGRDDDRRSTLRTTETISATFPDFDQNRGLERAFVKTYQDRSTSFELLSVTDGQGNDLNYHWSGDALRIGDKDTYVYGEQTYQISFSQRDVTRYFEDTDADEFFWDVIGVDWRVPIERAAIELTLDQSLVNDVTTELNCYRGLAGSNQDCGQAFGVDGNYTALAADLSPNEGVTLALGFEPNTFAEYQPSLAERFMQYFAVAQVLSSIAAVPATGWLLYRFNGKKNREDELKPIAPEYAPPEEISVSTASHLVPKKNVMAAQLVDLAVRGYLNLNQVQKKRWFKSAEYEVEVKKDPSQLRAEEQELLKDTFGSLPNVGQTLNLKSLMNNTSFQRRLMDNDKKLKDLIRDDYNLRAKDNDLADWMTTNAKRLAILGLLTFTIPALIAAFIVFVVSYSSWRLTDEGLMLKRRLLGLKDYIELAEKDRIAFLQSPEGAETAPAAANDEHERMILYEKTLPYAMLFGQEEGWSDQLGRYYQKLNTEPGWYHGAAAFNASNFSSDIGNISSAARSASSYSSSTGGSSGGGFSGGGGGGGGGGGW